MFSILIQSYYLSHVANQPTVAGSKILETDVLKHQKHGH